MTEVVEDTKARIERLVRDNPRLSATHMAEIVKVTRARVSQVLRELGYERVWRKRENRDD